MEKLKVLLVEDEDIQRKLIARWIELDCGLEVIAVADPIAAHAHMSSPDVVLLITDVLLSGASGFDVLRMSKKVEPTRPVMLMSAHRNLNATLSKDADHVFYKPQIQRGALVERVRALVFGGATEAEPTSTAGYTAVTTPPASQVIAADPKSMVSPLVARSKMITVAPPSRRAQTGTR